MAIYTKGGAIDAVVNDTSVTGGVYTSGSALRVTPVPGTSYVGKTAPDGSTNVVSALDGLRGLYHPSGAIRANFSNQETALSGLYHRSGALNMYTSVSNATLSILGEPNALSLDFLDNTSDIVTSGVSVKSTGTGTITFTRASLATVTDSDGKIKWAPHNLVLNSGSPVTQSITVVSGAQYTVHITGAGSVALSGAGTGTVTAASPVTVTASTTTLTLTVTAPVTTMWAYRSDLGGMQLNGAGSTYNATTGAIYHGPRLDFDGSTLAAKGLLVEEQRTNLFLQSENFASASWIKANATISAGSTTSPDGTVNASKLVESATTNLHYFVQQRPSTASVAHTATLYVKTAERTRLRFQLDDGSANGASCDFNLTGTPSISTGVFGTGSAASGSATLVGNGWYRCSLSCIPATTGSAVRIVVYLQNNAGAFSYAGDGTSGLHIWGAQLEAGAFATSYIPTGASTVTRSADVASVATSAFPYSSTEGTVVFAGDYIGQSSTSAYSFTLNDGTAVNFTGLRRAISNGSQVVVNVAANVQDALIVGPIITNNTTYKTAVAYKVNDYAAVTNGTLSGTDTVATVPTTTTLGLGQLTNNSFLNGHIRQITYLPRRISNAELQARTL